MGASVEGGGIIAKVTKTHRWDEYLITRVEEFAEKQGRPVQHVLEECVQIGITQLEEHMGQVKLDEGKVQRVLNLAVDVADDPTHELLDRESARYAVGAMVRMAYALGLYDLGQAMLKAVRTRHDYRGDGDEGE